MSLHQELSAIAAVDHQRALLAQADRYRLLAAVRRGRRERKTASAAVRDTSTAATLGGCGRSVAPAR